MFLVLSVIQKTSYRLIINKRRLFCSAKLQNMTTYDEAHNPNSVLRYVRHMYRVIKEDIHLALTEFFIDWGIRVEMH